MSEIKAGNWYFFIKCKNCGVMVAIGDAPAPEEVSGPVETNHGPLQIHCNACGADKVYKPADISIRQVVRPQ